jgi:hypothetical protein
MNRSLKEELLDHLDPGDPGAVRSRRDLRLIDLFLGNSRWILSSLRDTKGLASGVIELGAGEGHLCRRMLGLHPGITVTGLDRAPKPESLPAGMRWVQGDFMETLATVTGSVCCGALILHHFPEGDLRRLGAAMQRFDHLLFTEPYRSKLPLAMAGLVAPFAGEVTRHDMPASIRAGFREGELPLLLGLNPNEWSIREIVTLRGSLRLAAHRR